MPADVRTLIRTMAQANPRWGAPRIHGEPLKLGIDVCQATVAKYMVRRRQLPSQMGQALTRSRVGACTRADPNPVLVLCEWFARAAAEDRYRLSSWCSDFGNCPRISPPGFNGVACTLT